jgi:hypothetical protein
VNETVCSVRWTFVVDVMEETGQAVTMVDGDQWFWSSPEQLFEEIGDAGCAVTPHAFPMEVDGKPGVTFETHRKFGLYNGGWVYFADVRSARLLAELARAWCYIGFREHHGRTYFGDQGYLEILVEDHGAHVVRHPGVNVGPWSVHGRDLEQRDGGVWFGGRPLVSYHYSSFREDGQIASPGYEITARQARILYDPYVNELRRRT